MSKLASLFLKEEKPSKKENTLTNSPYKILFIDDEKNVLEAMRRIFRLENYIILTAESGQQALEILKKETVNIVITDYRMPNMNGADLLYKIKELYPNTIRIMLTGYADVNAIMGAVNEGAAYKFITKPWNNEDLRLTVSLALEQYDLIQENQLLKKQTEVQKKKLNKLNRYINVNRSQLGPILLRKNLIKKTDLEKAIKTQQKTNQILPQILIEMKILDEKTILNVIETDFNINRVYPNEFTVPKNLLSILPMDICSKNILIPLKIDNKRLIVSMADPTDFTKVNDLKFITGMSIQPVLSTQKEILEKLNELSEHKDKSSSEMISDDEMIAEFDLTDPLDTIEIILENDEEDVDINELLKSKDRPPAIRIVNAIISESLRYNASDVHIEPKNKYVIVRYRLDGLLTEKIRIPLAMHPSIVSRIKIMCEMDITERRKPQDGRVTIKSSSKIVDMRISTLPTINGEKVVLRILDKNAAIKDISELGLEKSNLVKLIKMISQPQGIILTTGPTGSGKTTSLYSLLQHVATKSKNYTTIEDPVEYSLGMAEQVLVREKIGLKFSTIMRSLLRQDPDVIMLGEIRDAETAQVAFHAAMTGHLVLSTLHTNSAIASITRLKDIGLKSFVINDALNGIIAQRLLRKICPHCKVDDHPSEEELKSLKLNKNLMNFTPKKGEGCEKCNQTGYKGRLGIFEVFQMDNDIKKMIYSDISEIELLRAAKWAGMKTLLEDATEKLKQGITTCEEILRVLGPQNTIDITCPNCSILLDERFQFCPYCGKTIIPYCKKCGKFLNDFWIFCPYCGNGDDNKQKAAVLTK